MLNFFRKSQKTYSVIIVAMLLLSVQQSFARTTAKIVSHENNGLSLAVTGNNYYPKISIAINDEQKNITNTEQRSPQVDCCLTNGCDSSCPNVISFIALVSDDEFDSSHDSISPMFYFQLRHNRVLPSELFRPPRLS